MKGMFLANFDLGENEGIYKKVNSQSEAIGFVIGDCELVTRKGDKTSIKYCGRDNAELTDKPFWDYVYSRIQSGDLHLLYVRHMIPSHRLIRILKLAKSKNIKIYYEIPTYPYFAEQIKTSRRKYRAIAKVGIDIIFWPWIYHEIDHLVVIKSNSKVKTYSKMIEITNGVNTANIKTKKYHSVADDNCFRLVAVGTLYPYHGYDRVLKGLAECREEVNGIRVEFHVVGASQTIDELRNEANNLGLKNVMFHGIKTTEELNKMYDEFDIGLGCLALHRRNADIDTTLKIIEYYCRGVPVVTSGITPLSNPRYTCIMPDTDESINISSIYSFYSNFSKPDTLKLSQLAKKEFSWVNIMTRLIKKD